jgi:hypothetical protein
MSYSFYDNAQVYQLVYILKLCIARKKGQVRACPNATNEYKEKCLKAIED